MTRLDRQRGTLLGLAIGDALGAAVEFQYPDTFEPVTGYRAGGPQTGGQVAPSAEEDGEDPGRSESRQEEVGI